MPEPLTDANRLVRGSFVERPNRFIVIARTDAGRLVRAHLADPGRLRELLVPGAELRLRRAAPSATRKTGFSVALVRAGNRPAVWVSVDSTLPNRLAGKLLLEGRVRGIGPGWAIRREVARGRSRFDFMASSPGGSEMFIEVKSVTLVENSLALFPDAPTRRGTRHVRELTEIAGRGGGAMVLFVVQRHDARAIVPNRSTDPDFAAAVATAHKAGVLLRGARFRLDSRGRAEWLGPLPVRLG